MLFQIAPKLTARYIHDFYKLSRIHNSYNPIYDKYEGCLKSSRPNNEKNEFIISKLFLFFNIISLKTNIFIPAMLHRHYPVPVVVLRKICKIPLYSCNRLLIRRKTLTSEEEF